MDRNPRGSYRVTTLDHRATGDVPLRTLAGQIDLLAERLDQTHPMERKVRFLLDVRGLIKVNAIAGSYIEFGSYRSEMQYAACRVLEATGQMDRYVGLDTFTGEPEMSGDERLGTPTTAPGDFACNFDEVRNFVDATIGERGALIRGDFRQADVIEQAEPFAPFNVAVVDCNLVSSIYSSLGWVIERMTPGGVLYLDDYFADLGGGEPRTAALFADALDRCGRYAMSHGFYAPFGRSFVIIDEPVESERVMP